VSSNLVPDMPPELEALMRRLWVIKKPIRWSMRPREAWIILSVIQFASRNPMLTPTHQKLMRELGDQLQRAIVAIEPEAGQYLEMGWDPQFDVPTDRGVQE